MELRPTFGVGIVTALARIGGHSVGIIANNPAHLGGAIDSDAADKASRFVQLCDAHDLPIVSLCDTPGFMVGPEAEKTAQVRHFSRMFVVAGSITVPWLTVILRKCYGLGAQAMAGGTLHGRYPTLSWPTGARCDLRPRRTPSAGRQAHCCGLRTRQRIEHRGPRRDRRSHRPCRHPRTSDCSSRCRTCSHATPGQEAPDD